MKIRTLVAATAILLTASQARAVEVSFEKDSSLPIVYLNVALKTGSVTDPKGQEGLSSFMGEMLLRGTRNRDKEQIDLELDQLGSSIEVETRAEALILRGVVLSKNLDRYLELVTDLITHPSFPEREISKFKSMRVAELLEELSSDRALGQKKHEKHLFGDHPYGTPVTGTVSSVRKFTRAQIEAHYRRLFNKDAIVVVGTGDASQGRIKAWAEELNLPEANGEGVPRLPVPSDASARRLMIVDKPDRSQTWIFGSQIGVTLTEKDYFALYVGNHAFGGSFISTLMQEIRDKRGWSYGAGSAMRHGTVPRIWFFYTFPREKDTPAALKRMLELVEELKTKGISQADFDLAKNSLVNSDGFRYDTPKKRVENKLLEVTLGLPDGFMESYAREISKLTREDVNRALARYLKPDQLTLTVVGTAKNLKAPLAEAAGVPEDRVQVVDFKD